ncbi:MAG: hypothetical protein NT025_09750 [bacterium]|nr:hypothetical protein [bacterium]
MATKQFAVPLIPDSLQTGDFSFKEMVEDGRDAEFQITNVKAGGDDKLNLITQKDSQTQDHIFEVKFTNGTGCVFLTASEIAAVFFDADGVERDYVEARWIVGEVDTSEQSNMYEIQGDRTGDLNGWPPNH